MKIIKEIVENLKDELGSAEHYAKLATRYKDEDKALAENYAKMAEAELGHVNALHAQAVRVIKDWRTYSGKEPPAAMQAVFDYEHDNMIEKVARIKTLLSMYRGS